MHPDERARRLAARQAGTIGARQLRACGLSRRQILVRVRRGELVPHHRSVYRFGGTALTFQARVWAALLACRARAFASHRTAAVLWGVRRGEPDVVEITVIAGHAPQLPGVRVHRIRREPRGELRTRDGIRLSSPARAVCELAATEPRSEVEYAIQEAAARLRLTPHELTTAAARWGRRSGAAMLHSILQDEAGGEFSRSWAERRLAWIIRRGGLPRPQQNVHVEGHRVDAVWPEAKLVVEVDGIATHGTPVAFARDRTTDAELVAAGWAVLRFTARQLSDEPLLVAAQIGRVLGRG